MIDPRIAAALERDNGFPLEPHLVVLALMGSHSHGTYLPPEEPNAVDDVDLMGFVVPPLEYHIGLPRWQHWTFQFEELDVVLYSLDKAVRLLLKSNPNIVGLLWLARKSTCTDTRSSRSFALGATSSRRRKPQHRSPATRPISSSEWKRSRKAMVRKYQYDVKNAAHLIRLLRMGAEFIATGTLQVYRISDADELKIIKRGGWTLDQVKAEAGRLFELVEEARGRSTLPVGPDVEAANALLMELHRRILL